MRARKKNNNEVAFGFIPFRKQPAVKKTMIDGKKKERNRFLIKRKKG